MKTLGKKIAQIRKQKGLTQEELAESAKVNLRTIQRIEREETSPRGNTLRQICEVLEVNLEEIMDYGKEEDISYLTYFHLSALTFIAIPLGNIILPMILWLNKRDKIESLHEQGVNLLNFQLVWSVFASITFFFYPLLVLEHSEHKYWALIVYIALCFLNAVYILTVSYMMKQGKVRKYYPSIVRFIK